MLKDYLIVHKSILPECLTPVLKAKQLLENGKAKNVSQAVKEVGISRSTFYKYKDYVMEPSSTTKGRNAVLSMMLTHEAGVLSSVLTCISKTGASILTINQSLPIRNRANVTISMDISSMPVDITELLAQIKDTEGVESPKLVAVE